jgi:hypothetical protein
MARTPPDRHAECDASERTDTMSDTSDDLPLTLADLERVRADLQESVRHTEEMLERTQTLLLAAALLKYGVAIRLLQVEGSLAHDPDCATRPIDTAGVSTN